MKKYLDKGDHTFYKMLCTVVFVCANILVFGQSNELDVRSINTENFPEVKGKIWVRNPEGIHTESIQFFENDLAVSVNIESSQRVDTVGKNKVILFLIRNTSSQAEMDWYKGVLIKAFDQGVIKSGDKIDVVGFSCMVGKQILFPNKLDFTDNVKVLLERIDKIRTTKRIENRGRVQTDLAINEALNLLGNTSYTIPKGLFVLSDDLSMNSQLVGELPGERSHKLNIPIYGITYYKANTGYSIEQLCAQTFGRFSCLPNNSKDLISKDLTQYLNEFETRHSGFYYPFTYTSTFEKDGKTHIVKIKTKEGLTNFSFAAPSKNLMEQVQDNPLVSAVIFLVLIGLVIVIVLFVKKNKLKRQQLEMERLKQITELEQKQQSANDKLSQQESEMQRLKAEEQLKRQQAEKEKMAQAKEEEDERQIQKMLERGNFPWFEYRFGDMFGNYQIQSPTITVGRDPNNTWVINHPTVSRQHFELSFKDYVYKIRDLGSSNGLLVNDYKTTEAELKHGDCIQIGEIVLTFHI